MLLEIEKIAKSYCKPRYTVVGFSFSDYHHHVSIRYSWEDVKQYICGKECFYGCTDCPMEGPCDECFKSQIQERKKLMDRISSKYPKGRSCFIKVYNSGGWSVVRLPNVY